MDVRDVRNLLCQMEYSDINRYFADFMLKLSGGRSPELYLACGLLSHRVEQGDVCLSLGAFGDSVLHFSVNGQAEKLSCPSAVNWVAALQESPVVGNPGDTRPLILDAAPDNPRLYLYRSWRYENRLAEYVRRARSGPTAGDDSRVAADRLLRLFPGDSLQPGGQGHAAETALQNRFCVITGGPGTGKTTTVLKIILLLLEEAGSKPYAIALAAPTGKAANRLRESIRVSLAEAREKNTASEQVLAKVPAETVTIHRLLGNIANSPRFRHDSDHPLSHDCVIIDEASMVDLALMSKLVDALKPGCRLILLGDRNQLSSVEAGSVLADICEVPADEVAAGDSRCSGIVSLAKSYRFVAGSTIGQLSRHVNAGEAEAALRIMDGEAHDIRRRETPAPDHLGRSLAENLLETYRSRIFCSSAADAFRQLSQFCIISALRNGPYGSVALNRLIEQMLRENGIISGRDEWYRGRPVMITRNDYHLALYNGDIGIALPEDGGERLKVFFESGPGKYRAISPFRLPEHETAYAVTIHKSQGSEFDRVLMIFPDRDSPVLTRELVYTGITRARQAVEIWADEDILRPAIGRRTSRSSGLARALYG